MADKKNVAITGNESELNNLFKEVLDGLRDDLLESQENVDMYLDSIKNDPGGKELYGSLYNDSLKIKGMSRDRQLKFLNMFKDRVSKKEMMSIAKKETTGNEFALDHGNLNDWVQKIKNQQYENAKPEIDLAPPQEEPQKEEIEEQPVSRRRELPDNKPTPVKQEEEYDDDFDDYGDDDEDGYEIDLDDEED